jgi:Kef-type K+ transport system membrane component KefB
MEIGGAIALGSLFGLMVEELARYVHPRALLLPLIFSAVLLVVGLAESWHLSPLLAAMSLGFVARVAHRGHGERLLGPVEYMEELIFLIFFTLAGAHFSPSVFTTHLHIIVTYLLARVAGKLLGATLGASLGGAPRKRAQYLGLALVPQAGVAMGLALSLLAIPDYRELATVLINVLMASTIIFELAGPFTTRYALARVGELGEKRGRPRL